MPASFRPSRHTDTTRAWDYYEADSNFSESPLPTVGNWPSQATLSPPKVAAYHKMQASKAALAAALASSSALPVGSDDLYLVADTAQAAGEKELLPEETPRFYQKSWFWPVVIFGMALGVVGSLRGSEA
tara:strand:+ start:160 stop:546 length:387 start_codon:yes stop_codon:yes gene_type:complete